MVDVISPQEAALQAPLGQAIKPARIKWVDIFKGLAIFAVVVGHSNSPLAVVVYPFHLPAFFFISGYVTRLESVPIGPFIRRRIDTLLVPFFCYNLLFIALTALLSFHPALARILAQPFSPAFFETSIRQLFVELLAPTDLGGPTWFLPCLLATAVLGWLLTHLVKVLQLGAIWVVGAALWLFFYILSPGHLGSVQTLFSADLACIGGFYYTLGAYCKSRQILENHIRPGVALLTSGVVLYGAQYFFWIKSGFVERNFSPPCELIIGALAGIYMLYFVSKLLARVKWVSEFWVWIGENSLVILAMHFVAFRCCFVVLHMLGRADDPQLSKVVPGNAISSYWLLISFAGTLLPLLFALGCRHSRILSKMFLAK